MERRLFILSLAGGLALPSVAAAHQFVAYYASGQSDLTTTAYRMCREVAQYAARLPSNRVRVKVWSHLDGLEAKRFGRLLSIARGQEVVLELARLDVAYDAIRLDARLDDQLARPREHGADEPLNRRVTVDINMLEPVQPPAPVDWPPIYFEPDSAALSSVARYTLRAIVASDYRPGRRLIIRTHDEANGSAARAERLSRLRAETVARFVAMQGAPWSDIELIWTGDAELAVPRQGRVPENRRVTVDVRTAAGRS